MERNNMEKIIRGQIIKYDGRKVDSYDPPLERLFRILGKKINIKEKNKNGY